MHIEQVDFDEVFDVQAGIGDFSFRSGGKPVYGVNLRNGFVPAAGSRYAVAFERAGDWNSVLAWRALGTQKVQFKLPGWSALLMLLADFFWFVPCFVAGGLVFAGPWMALAMAVAFLLLVALGAAWSVRRQRRIERALLAFDESSGGRDKGGMAQAGAAV